MQNKRGNTALHFAYEQKRDTLVELLTAAGAVELRNNIGLTPQTLALHGDANNGLDLNDEAQTESTPTKIGDSTAEGNKAP